MFFCIVSGKVPLYEQTRVGILSLIQNGLVPGELLPTQEELSRQLGASLITIKRAISELERDYIVESVRGRGTVVKGTTITDRHAGVSSWTDSVTGLGESPETGWTVLERHIPAARLRHLLNLKAREHVVTVKRLRLAGGKPICLMWNCLPAERVPGLEDRGISGESLYQCLRERYGLHFSCAKETVRAREASAEEAKYLGEDAGIVLEIERLTEDDDGQVAEWAKVVAHAGRYSYQTQLTNTKKTK